MGAAATETSITHDFPIGSSLAAAAANLGWLLPYIAERRRVREQDSLLRRFHGYLYAERQ
jgi:hypothetical protein